MTLNSMFQAVSSTVISRHVLLLLARFQMATASITDPSGHLKEIVLREKMAINFFDSFIDSRQSKYGANHEIFLSELTGLLQRSADQHVKNYIGTTYDKIMCFIGQRSYLWKLEDTLLKKQSPEWRGFFVSVVEYLQKRNLIADWGASVKALGSFIGQHAPMVKTQLGRGNDIIKSTLLAYPSLFVWDPNSPNDTFVNRAWVVDGVILLPEVSKIDHPVYMEGDGTVTKCLGNAGFLKADASGESIYFKLSAESQKVRVGQKYCCKSIISRAFQRGETKNKWVAFLMESAQMSKPTDSATSGHSVSPAKSNLETAPSAKKEAPDHMEQFMTSHSDSAQGNQIELNDFFESPPCWNHELQVEYSLRRQSPLEHGLWLESMGDSLSKLGADIIVNVTPASSCVNPRVHQNSPVPASSLLTSKTDKSTSTDITDTRDHIIQTDPVPDRVEVLRLLHRNPGLAEVVEPFIHAIRS